MAKTSSPVAGTSKTFASAVKSSIDLSDSNSKSVKNISSIRKPSLSKSCNAVKSSNSEWCQETHIAIDARKNGLAVINEATSVKRERQSINKNISGTKVASSGLLGVPRTLNIYVGGCNLNSSSDDILNYCK